MPKSTKDATAEIVWQNSEVSGEEFRGTWQGYSDDEGDVVVLYGDDSKPCICLRVPIIEG